MFFFMKNLNFWNLNFLLKGEKLKFSSWWKNLKKTFVWFLYHLHPLFHLKVLQEVPSKLAKHRLGANVRRHVELHPLAMGTAIAAHHAAKALADAEGLVSCLVSLIECCGRVWWCTLSYPGFLRLPMPHQYYTLWKHTNHILSSLCIHSLSPSQF